MKILFSLTTLCFVTAVMTANPLIVAHRGASFDAPENTLPAFELAWKQGADAIEGDFRLTADGHIVCIHDQDTDKYSNTNLVVAESTFEALRQLDIGAYRGDEFTGTRIPTLGEVLRTVPSGKKIYIEIKSDKKIVPTLVKEIETSDLNDNQIVIIAFDAEVIRAIKSVAPQFKACWLSGFKRDTDGALEPTPQTVLDTLKDIDADGFSSSNKLIYGPYIQEILDQGFEYHVWTVDDPVEAKRFKDWGTLSITTNKPGFIREQLELD
jgi:glycerophosphoryl diester phosphodiesterase